MTQNGAEADVEDELKAAEARNAALVEQMERIADLSERWTDSLVSQVNEIARAILEKHKDKA
jgi:hypothetical protein